MSINPFPQIDKLLNLLDLENDKNKALNIAIELANEFLLILNNELKLNSAQTILEDLDHHKLVDFPNHKVAGWFNKHPIYADYRVAMEHFNEDKYSFESKFYWLNETATKARVSAGVMLTQNWEDSSLTKFPNYKVGIDFFLTNDTKSLLVVLSNQYKLRVLELSKELTNTQIEIFKNIQNAGKLSTQELIHTQLWNSFALKKVNEKFFERIAELFTELFQFLSKNKEEQDSKMFANRLIGRLLFIWFLRKKNLINEAEDYFNPDSDSTTYYKTKLKPLFF